MVWVLVFNATLYFSYIVAVIFCIFRFDTFYFKKRTHIPALVSLKNDATSLEND
jgi:hypothetical protein